MIAHTQEFKEEIKEYGKEIDIYGNAIYGNDNYSLTIEELNEVSWHYEGNILKSVMKELTLDSNIELPIGATIDNLKFGVRVRDDETAEDYRDNYDYIRIGKYIINSIEKQEDTESYKITCYDNMIKSMVDYEQMNITYPISIRNYLSAICNHLGIVFASANDTFTNYDKMISSERYLEYNDYDEKWESIGYTFRDVFDELAQVTASTICINENGELEVRYINNTNEVIDEEYLKDVNVTFKEQYGPLNTIILSRASGSDKIYKSYPENLPDEDKIAIEIADNQIMSGNDRDEYIDGILNQLKGLQFYLNDFSSTGIGYLDLCDRYDITIGQNTYSCVMLNDELNVSQGVEEIIHTEELEETVTDYKKADKTDRKINQTNLTVDKQQGQIDALVNSVKDLTDYINIVEGDSQITLVDTMKSSGSINYIEITNLTPLNLYPGMAYPGGSTYPNVMTMYTIITQNDNNYKETYIDLGIQLVSTDRLVLYPDRIIIQRSGGTTIRLEDVKNVFETFDETTKLSIKYFDNAHIKCEYLKKNDFTTQFATQAELSSSFSITDALISSKVSKAEVISAINQSAEEVSIQANKIKFEGLVTANENFKILENGSIETKNGIFKDGSIYLNDEEQTINVFQINKATDERSCTVASNGISVDTNVLVDGVNKSLAFLGEITSNEGNLILESIDNLNYQLWASPDRIDLRRDDSYTYVTALDGIIHSSKEEYKKNIKLKEHNIELIKKANVYTYLFNQEEDDAKEHIGLIIGEKYNTPEEVMNSNKDGIEIYNMCGVMWGAIKEQQKMIEDLQNEVEKLKEGK